MVLLLTGNGHNYGHFSRPYLTALSHAYLNTYIHTYKHLYAFIKNGHNSLGVLKCCKSFIHTNIQAHMVLFHTENEHNVSTRPFCRYGT